MNVQDFLGIAIVGAALSLVIQIIKNKLGPTSNATRLITLALSVLIGAAYWFLRDTNLWQTILGVLAAASTVYAFFLKNE